MLRASSFEWSGGERVVALLWIPLLALVAMPYPLFSAPLIERAIPIFWLLLAGAALLFTQVARVSWPFAALLAWATLRTLWMGLAVEPATIQLGALVMDVARIRPLQLVLLLSLVGLLYAAARGLAPRWARAAAWMLVLGVAWEAAFGYLNLWGIYPWMSFVVPEYMGRPMGFLTHPNYWGSFLALGLPVVWALCGIPAAAIVYALILSSVSAGPVIAATVGVLVMAWPELDRRLRLVILGAAASTVAVVMTVHEWRLSGRWENWVAIWPELSRYPVIGQGLGAWRVWADHYNAKLAAQTGKPEIFATLQAHNEPYQLWFELGLIGLGLAALWALQAWLAVRGAWALCPPGKAAPWYAPGRAPLERAWIALLATALVNALGSPLFHLPAQAALTLFAVARIQAQAALTPPAPPALHRAPARTRVRVTRGA
jgi:hypothetical protein